MSPFSRRLQSATLPGLNVVSYQPSTDVIANPERGFFQYSETHYASDNSGYQPLDVNSLITGRQSGRAQVFRYFYLEKFFGQDTIDNGYLNQVVADLQAVKDAGCKIVARFAYSNNPNNTYTVPYTSEPTVARVVAHIGQLAGVLNSYADIIETLQAGFIGYWGEWYYTDNFTSDPSNPGSLAVADWNKRGQVLNALLGQLDSRIFVSVRYVGVHQYFAASWDAATVSRVGFHNDAFKASSDDYGTFTTFSSQSESQNKAYLANVTAQHVPMGGESATNNPPLSSWPSASADLAAYHWNYLNPLYDPQVIADWGPTNITTAELLLGYRLRLIDSSVQTVVKAGQSMNILLTMTNDGYAAPLRNRPVEVVFIGGAESSVVLSGIDIRDWQPGHITTIHRSILAPTSLGQYTLYLRLSDSNASLKSLPPYMIQLATINTWDDTTGLNDLKQVVRVV